MSRPNAPAESTSAVRYAVHSGAEGLARVRDDWRRLELTGAQHVFQTFAYADLWQRHIGASNGATALIVTLEEDGRVVGIFPACRLWDGAIPMVVWLGGPKSIDYGDVIFDATSARTSLDDFVATSLRLLGRHARGAVLYLSNVRDDAHAFEPLRSRLRVFKQTRAPFAPIEGTWDEYLADRSRTVRHNFNHKWRKLASEGDTDMRLLRPADEGVEPAFARLVEFQRARHTGVARTDLFDERYVAFRRDQVMTEPHSLLSEITVDGTCIAACSHALFRGRLYCMVTGFDETYAVYSPGMLLEGLLVRSCYENGWSACDFCWGDETHKYHWSDRDIGLTTFISDDAKGLALSTVAAIARRLGPAGTAQRGQPEHRDG